MFTVDVPLKDRELYLYHVEHNPDETICVTSTTVTAKSYTKEIYEDESKENCTSRTTYYEFPFDGVSIIVAEYNLGRLYNLSRFIEDTYMVLETADKAKYLKALKNLYSVELDKILAKADKYEKYLECLSYIKA